MAIEDFAQTQYSQRLDVEVQHILNNPEWLLPEQWTQLALLVAGHLPPEEADGPINLQEEIEAQIGMVKLLRREVASGGRLKPGMSTKDAKEVLSASTTLFQTLMRYKERADQYERMRRIEEACVSFLSEIATEKQRPLLEELERRLSLIE